MRRLSRALQVLTVLLAALSFDTSAKADGKEYRLVGFSQTEFQGNAGFAAMHADCRATFDKNARMCTTEEIVGTPDLDDVRLPPDESAWVQPIAAGAAYEGVGRLVVVDRHFATFISGTAGSISCNGWTRTSSFGTSYSSFFGTIFSRFCVNRDPVACCTMRKVSR